MLDEIQTKKILEGKMETYQRIKGTSKISESVLEGWVNALRVVLEMPQVDIRKI